MADGYSFQWTPKGKKMKAAFEKLGGLSVKVGYQRGKKMHVGKGKNAKKVDMADIAAWNEFGTSTIPPRPFLKGSIDNYQDEIKTDMTEVCKAVVNGTDPIQALSALGAKHVGRVQRSITECDWTPNKPSTIRKKGSDHPLIDTGQLRQSVHYEVSSKEE